MPEALYDAIAQWYDDNVRKGLLLHEFVLLTLFELMGDVRGKTVCDLACGQGEIARQLARRGARVTGIDLSAKLLEIARQDEQNEPAGILYLQDDAQSLSLVQDAAFDLVVCNLALMDIPDLTATYKAVWRILRPGGTFTFSLTHPCLLPPGSYWMKDEDGVTGRFVRGYFQERYWRSDNIQGVRGQVGAYHCTLSTYINTLLDAGFRLERLSEPQATGAFAERLPGSKEAPVILIVKCRK